ncbi:hypothetical protein [Rhizobium laguerreae]|uniref:hypothetical protein n=1 Tax=Rhizobium laguerreae TaxID=1076926 RepID=UPI003704A8F9
MSLPHERELSAEIRRASELWTDRPGAAMECYAVWPTTQYLPLRSRLAIDALATELPKRFVV